MTRNVRLLFTPEIFQAVKAHLFPGDDHEHAGVLLCGWSQAVDRIILTVREFHPARDGIEYTLSPQMHGRIEPLFIDDCLSQAQEQGLCYIAIHNHLSVDWVAFSKVDLRSHEYGYPTLLRLNKGLPVGAAVFGANSIEVDIWMPEGTRHQLAEARVVGSRITHLWASTAHAPVCKDVNSYDRQLPFLRNVGQGLLSRAKVVIVGVGGLGSQLLEPLVRLGVRRFVIIDPDRIESTNYSRLHGARPSDLLGDGMLKVAIAARLIKEIAPDAEVLALPADVAKGDVHQQLITADFLLLAADTPEARLTCNAVAQQYYVPMIQVGTKVQVKPDGSLQGVFGAVRHVRPGDGCLWCNGLVDRAGLANASKSKDQREAEKYGVDARNPAVVTFNAEVAGRTLNELLLAYVTSSSDLTRYPAYTLIDLLSGEREIIHPTKEIGCPFCGSQAGGFLGASNSRRTPVVNA